MFDMSIPIPLILVMVGIVIFGVVAIVFGSRSQKDQNKEIAKALNKLYTFFSRNFLTSGRMTKIAVKLQALSIYDRAELQAIATKQFLISNGVSIVLIVGGLVMFKDIVTRLMCVVAAIVLNTVLVDKSVEKIEKKVYLDLRSAISSIRQEYLRLNSVSEAVSEADIPVLLRKPFDEIHQILISADGELLLMKFYESSPFRALQTLAGICYNINNYGDQRDASGQSNFVQALTMLSSDVNSELTRIQYMKTKFGIIEYLPLVPILCINIIEKFLIGAMPGAVVIYSGIIGYFIRIMILVMSVACYKIISSVNSSSSV